MIPKRQWSRQSVVSCILLMVLCSIAVSIVWVHEKGSLQAPDTFPLLVAVQSTSGSLELFSDSLLTLPPGFDLSGKQEQYNPESLYEKINGKAPLYLEAGFVILKTQRFIDKEDPSLWFELFVYDMGTALNAFSVYSTQRRAGSQKISSLEPFDHYKTENGLYLRHGPYYIECVGSSFSSDLDEAMVAIGLNLLSADSGSGTTITELQLFPDENLVPGSFKLILNNAFGSEVLDNIFVAKYRLNDQIITAFISILDSPEKAKQTAASYSQFLLDGGGTPENSVNAMQLVDLYGLVEVFFTVGPYVAGIHEGESSLDALEIARRLRASLAKVKEK